MTQKSITIEKMVNGGHGLGRLASGQVVLIHHALPQEIVNISVEESKKRYRFGKIKEIIRPHAERLIPECPYYGACGGCNLQHCQYSTQLEIKKSILEDLLQRQPGLTADRDVLPISSPIPSPEQFGYRQRIRLQVDDNGKLGFNRALSHTVVPIAKCLLAAGEINQTLALLQNHPENERLVSLADEVEIQLNPGTGKTVTTYRLQRKPRPADITSARTLCSDIAPLDRVFFSGNDFPLSGPYCQTQELTDKRLVCISPELSAKIPPLNYSWEIGGFSQVNTRQNWNLIKTVVDLSDTLPSHRVLDLFCGMGNISIPLAFFAGYVMGIEGQGAAIRSAKINATNAGLTNTDFYKNNVHTACKKLAKEGDIFDLTVIDPPRQGVPGLAPCLSTITKKQLIYISCDPATLCRDTAELLAQGFHLQSIQPIDMFPQTSHLETIVSFRKA